MFWPFRRWFLTKYGTGGGGDIRPSTPPPCTPCTSYAHVWLAHDGNNEPFYDSFNLIPVEISLKCLGQWDVVGHWYEWMQYKMTSKNEYWYRRRSGGAQSARGWFQSSMRFCVNSSADFGLSTWKTWNYYNLKVQVSTDFPPSFS